MRQADPAGPDFLGDGHRFSEQLVAVGVERLGYESLVSDVDEEPGRRVNHARRGGKQLHRLELGIGGAYEQVVLGLTKRNVEEVPPVRKELGPTDRVLSAFMIGGE